MTAEAFSPGVLNAPPQPHCDPTLDINGQCNCSSLPSPHVPNLPSLPAHTFPKCREECLRLLYIDDALLATSVKLDQEAVPLIPTLGPHSILESCQLGVPGVWNSLEHRIRDVDRHARAIGLKLNDKKTNLIMFNPTWKKVVPFVSVVDGDPLPVVSEMRLLGLVLDCDLTWWPMVRDLVSRCRSTI